MAFVQQEIPLIVSSDPTSGSTNLSSDGSSFTVNVTNQACLSVPRDAVNVQMGVSKALIYNVSPNVFASGSRQNNKFKITLNLPPVTIFEVTLPEGLYSIDDIQTFMVSFMANITAALANAVVFSAIPSSGHVNIASTNAAFQLIDFQSNVVYQRFGMLLGFNPITYAFSSAGFNNTSPDVATLNSVNSYLLTSSLIPNGMPVNGAFSGVLAQIPIDVPPGSQIIYRPPTVDMFDASQLAGASVSQFSIALRADNGSEVTMGEYFSATLRITYMVPYALKSASGRFVG
jgi:hypothetical protein